MLPAKGQLSRLRTALSRHRAALSRLIRMIRMIRVVRGRAGIGPYLAPKARSQKRGGEGGEEKKKEKEGEKEKGKRGEKRGGGLSPIELNGRTVA